MQKKNETLLTAIVLICRVVLLVRTIFKFSSEWIKNESYDSKKKNMGRNFRKSRFSPPDLDTPPARLCDHPVCGRISELFTYTIFPIHE